MTALLGAFLLLSAPVQPEQRADDETAIRALVAAYATAREQQDVATIEALFTADADQLVSSGEWRRGRAALAQGMIASSQRTGGRRTLAVESVRFLAPGVALADARYEISGTASGSRRMWSTFAVVKAAEGWRIGAIRNMLPAAPVPSAPAR